MVQLHFINYVSKEFGILLMVINIVQQLSFVWHFTTLRPDATSLILFVVVKVYRHMKAKYLFFKTSVTCGTHLIDRERTGSA